MAAEWHPFVTTGLGVVGIVQALYIFFRTRKDKEVDNHRVGCYSRMDKTERDLSEHIKEDREMHERVQKSETLITGLQQQINNVNSRHGELVSRIDQIHNTMLTKDDLKLLIDVIKAGKLS